jgi:exodeoxyribonuclease-1
MALVFYDTETTGTETFFDQILQFAAIRTDENLKEIERFEIRSRLLPHVVPSPEAMSITGIRVFQLTDPSTPSHYEMVRSIFAKLDSWSPALFVGWNSIDFDENMIRQAFYKTLHNPYLTSRVGNSRTDVMRIVQACSLFAPDALVFPVGDDGEKIFKLAQVAPANGYTDDLAHDAMSDVEATIHLCRLLLERAPIVWSSFMRLSKKAAVVDYISEERVFCVTDFYFGKPYSHLVTTLGQNAENKAEWYLYDLSIEPALLESLNDEELAARLAERPKPVRRLKSNAAPMLFSADDAPEFCPGRELGTQELEKRAEALQNDSALRQKLIFAFEAGREEFPVSPHVEQQIYDAFFEKSDETLMSTFHQTDWDRRLAIVEKFQDARLRTIGKRLIHLERPHLLDAAICREHDAAAAKRLLGQCEAVSWLTLPQAISQLTGMMDNAEGIELEKLREFDLFLRNRHDTALIRASDP